MSGVAQGAISSPNIWRHPEVYEQENLAADPEDVIGRTIRSVHDWAGAAVLDIGCGSGFHLSMFAATAPSVVGLEPHGGLVLAARRRTAALHNVRVVHGSAQDMPLPEAAFDVAHARWAYFFGPRSLPGLRQLKRVMRRGGTAFVIDNDASRSTFGRWFRRALPTYDQGATDAFFARNGWAVERREIRWDFERREDFEAVVRIEFTPDLADAILAEHAGTTVDYAIVVRHKTF